MQIRQITDKGVGGLKGVTKNTVAQLKFDGSKYYLHVANTLAYGLTSKRVSKKTDQLSEKLSNFPRLQTRYFDNVKETIWVTEAVAEHLVNIAQKDKCGYVAGICNSREERIIGSNAYEEADPKPKDAIKNDLVFIVHDVLYYEGEFVGDLPYKERYALVYKHFKLAGRYGEKINLKKDIIYAVDNIPIIDEDHAKKVFNYIAYELKREGIVLKDMDTGMSMKVKQERTADVFIIGYTDGKAGVTGKYLGKVGALELGVIKYFSNMDAKVKSKNRLSSERIQAGLELEYIVNVGQTSGFTDELRDEFTANKEANLGRIIEVEYMNWTGKKMRHPRFLRFRNNKTVDRVTLDQFES